MIDLHTHTTASDGSLTPTELVVLAVERGISILALTDHNTVAGLPEFMTAAQGKPLRAIPGAELTCELEGEELHILALDIPRENFSAVTDLMAGRLREIRQSMVDLTRRLQADGYAISYEEVRKAHPDSLINRAHIALAVVKAGYAPDVHTAIQTLLSEASGYYRPAKRLPAPEVISAIRNMGAIPVWAHPFLRFDESRIRRALTQLVPAGLAAMETEYVTYTPEQTAQARALAAEFGIKRGGGSDFHGAPKPKVRLGTGLGNLNIPESIAEQLLRR